MTEQSRTDEGWVFPWEPFTCYFCERRRGMNEAIPIFDHQDRDCLCDWYIRRMREENPSGTWAEMIESLYRLITTPTALQAARKSLSRTRSCRAEKDLTF